MRFESVCVFWDWSKTVSYLGANTGAPPTQFAEVEHYAPQMPFKVVATAGGDAAFEIDGRIILPQACPCP